MINIEIEKAIFRFIEDPYMSLAEAAKSINISPMEVSRYALEIYGRQEWEKILGQKYNMKTSKKAFVEP